MTGVRLPPTAARAIEDAAFRICSELGYAKTTVDMIAAEAAVSRRTLFRYYPSKAAAITAPLDRQMKAVIEVIESASADQTLLEVMHRASMASQFTLDQVPRWRAIFTVLGSDPALKASSAMRGYDYEQAVARFLDRRPGKPLTEAETSVVAGAVRLAWGKAFDEWLRRGDVDFTDCIDDALRALSTTVGQWAPGAPHCPRCGASDSSEPAAPAPSTEAARTTSGRSMLTERLQRFRRRR